MAGPFEYGVLDMYIEDCSMDFSRGWSNQSLDGPLQNQQYHEEDIVDPLSYLNGDSQRSLPSSPNSSAFSVGTSSVVVYQQKTQQHQPMASLWEHTDYGLESGEPTEESQELNCFRFTPSPQYFLPLGPTKCTPSPPYSPPWGPTYFTEGYEVRTFTLELNYCACKGCGKMLGEVRSIRGVFSIRINEDEMKTKLTVSGPVVATVIKKFKRFGKYVKLLREEELLIKIREEEESPPEINHPECPPEIDHQEMPIGLQQNPVRTFLNRQKVAPMLPVGPTKLRQVHREHKITRGPSREEQKHISQSCPNESSAVVQERNAQLNLDQDSEDFGNDEVEASGMGVEGTGEGEMEEGRSTSGCLGKRKRKVETTGGNSGSKKTNGVKIVIPFEDILRVKDEKLEDAAEILEVSTKELRQACREYGITRWPPHKEQKRIKKSCPNKSSIVSGLEGNAQLNIDQDSEDFGNDEVEAGGMGVEGTGEGEMEEGRLNSGCLGKRKRKVETTGGNRGSKKTNRVKIVIPFEDILRVRGEKIKDAATTLDVSLSTFKRVCRVYGIDRWPPRNIERLTNQSRPKESPVAVDHEGAQQLNSDILPSDQALGATVDTSSVILKVRLNDIVVKVPLSRPWKMSELEEKLDMRLKPLNFTSRTHYIKYKDEKDDCVCIFCDEDLELCISTSRPPDANSIEVFLEPKLITP